LGWRVLALLYDSVPMIPLLLLTSGLFLLMRGGRTVENEPLAAALEWSVVWLVIGLYAVLSWRYGGQTLGMRPWRLRVLARDGRPAPLKALCLRYAVASLTPGLCLLWAAFDSERRGLHDAASGTMFVRMDT
jgi:uncharacterized RDD family membrane protein YckC